MAAGGSQSDANTNANNVFKGGGSVSVSVQRGCSRTPGVTDTAQVKVTYTFTFATPVAALAKLAKSPTMTVIGAAPCRG